MSGVTKHEFMLQATLNGFVGLAKQTDRIGGEYIVACAEAAWLRLEEMRKSDEGHAKNLNKSAPADCFGPFPPSAPSVQGAPMPRERLEG